MADMSFKHEFLEVHNWYREQHSAPGLSLSSELCEEAQRWADHLLNKNTMCHSGTSNGENIYCFSCSSRVNLTGREAVDSWYSEIKQYSWSRPGYSSKTGHFSQVVWKDSTELGVGVASSGRKVFVIGQYRPAGNMNSPGFFRENVLPKVAGSSDITPRRPAPSGPAPSGPEQTVTCCSLQ